jgi:halogenation protein CepH
MEAQYDVVVIGGGPAGSCTASHLALQGRRVLLVEGKQFPREHIGESLLSMSMYLLRELGLEPALRDAGFPEKPGAVFVWGGTGKSLTLPMPYPGYAFQVLRSRFDQILLEHSERVGVTILREHWVRRLLRAPSGRCTGVTVVPQGGSPLDVGCDHVVDASGLFQFIARLLDLPIERDPAKRVAIGSYYERAARAEPPWHNAIVSEASTDGWLWFIPLSGGLTSVGFVGDEDSLLLPPGEVLDAQIRGTELTRHMLAPATLVRKARVLKYTNHIVAAPLWQDGFLLVGDAAMFVDPLFSTGVHAAIYSASIASAALSSVQTGAIPEHEAARWYDRRMRAHFRRVDGTVRLLYGVHPGTSPFWRRRDLGDIDDDAAEALVRDLGAVGMAFFVHAAKDGVLRLPPAIARRMPEFSVDFDHPTVPRDAVLELAPEVALEPGLMRHRGHLARAVIARHARRHTIDVEFPEGSGNAALLRAIDGRHSLGELLEGLGPDPKLARIASMLVGCGVVRPLQAAGAATPATPKPRHPPRVA